MDLFETRMKKRITQWDMAIATGLSQSKISLIERGYISPSQAEKLLLSKALGVPANQLEWPKSRRPTPKTPMMEFEKKS